MTLVIALSSAVFAQPALETADPDIDTEIRGIDLNLVKNIGVASLNFIREIAGIDIFWEESKGAGSIDNLLSLMNATHPFTSEAVDTTMVTI